MLHIGVRSSPNSTKDPYANLTSTQAPTALPPLPAITGGGGPQKLAACQGCQVLNNNRLLLFCALGKTMGCLLASMSDCCAAVWTKLGAWHPGPCAAVHDQDHTETASAAMGHSWPGSRYCLRGQISIAYHSLTSLVSCRCGWGHCGRCHAASAGVVCQESAPTAPLPEREQLQLHRIRT